MIEIIVPGRDRLAISFAVFDVNGTVAEDGVISPETASLLRSLAAEVEVHLLTADTYGTIAPQVETLPVTLHIIRPPGEREQKADIVYKFGASKTAVFGNGANDLGMFKEAALSVAVLSKEGCFAKLLGQADLLVPNPRAAVELLLNPTRIKATLRF
ncbi:MAG: HAD family hydrolase [Candidatus Aquicultorales bacterium]